MEIPLDNLNAKIFAAELHTRFKAQLANGTPIELQLFEVEERKTAPEIEVFFLRFRGPVAPRLPQRTYSVEHEKLGTFSIFLTAIGADQDGIDYESVFQRFRKKNSDSS